MDCEKSVFFWWCHCTVGTDVPESHEKASAAKMGTSTGNQTISYELTKRSSTEVHYKN